jgi:hypothetical protein
MASIFTTIGKTSSLINSLKGLVVAGDKTQISNLVIDCVHSEGIEYSNIITSHPIETKSSVSDHIYSEPITLTIDGTITDSSMRIFGIIETPLQKNSLDSVIKNAKGLLPLNSQEKPSQVAFKILETLCLNKEVVSVATKRKLYKNMAIEKLSVNEDDTTGHRLHFTCTLKQLTFARVKTTAYTKPKVVSQILKKSEANLAPEVDMGVTQPVDIKNESVLNKFFNKGLKALGIGLEATSPF